MRGGSAVNNKATSACEISSSASIPAASRKIVQNLREIVNSPEQEIYAMLKECNMDPNEAINRLLSQDPFHEVKSKKEKKKESKDPTEFRSRGTGGNSSRGRGTSDRNTLRNDWGHMSSSAGTGLYKASYKKESEFNAHLGSGLIVSTITENNPNRKISSASDCVGGVDEHPTSSFSTSSGLQQHCWTSPTDQVSAADIVKLGRAHGKSPSVPNSRDQVITTEVSMETGMTRNVKNHEWQSEMLPSGASPYFESAVADPNFILSEEMGSRQFKSKADEIHHDAEEDGDVNLNYEICVPTSLHTDEQNASLPLNSYDDISYDRLNSFQPRDILFDNEDEAVSVNSMAENLQQLSLPEEHLVESDEESCTVKIPDHLQVHSEKLLHLSFGTFGSASTATSRQVPPQALKIKDDNATTMAHMSGGYYLDEHRAVVSEEQKDMGHVFSQEERLEAVVALKETAAAVKGGAADASHVLYAFPTSGTTYTFDNNPTQGGMEIPSHASFSSAMAYTNSLPASLLPPGIQGEREAGLPYSPFPLPGKYGDPNLSASTMSMLLQQQQQQPQPQQQPMGVGQPPHTYSQPAALPLSHFASMIGYPLLPQSYTYLPSMFQQAFGGSSSYHHHPSVLAHYKSNSRGGGGFPHGGIPGAAAAPASSSYEELLRAQYKDTGGTALLSLQQQQQQQNENQAMWIHGHGTRGISGVATGGNTYYGFQGQSQLQQARQDQQQQFGYHHPGFYQQPPQLPPPPPHSVDHSQNNPPQQAQQHMWQNGY